MRCPWIPLSLLLLTSCHRHYIVREPLTAQQIIQWSSEGVAPEEIIRKIDASGTVFVLDSRDVVQLTERGVDPRVIDHMMETYHRDLRQRYRYREYYYYPPPPVGFGWYGPYW
ncbi:MAG: hypothetical protein JXA90_01800 [Planctomycetes bacterium]|nr:hypothetical protein [Planctomycetota bacterium]